MSEIAIIGTPNCGKTTVFNRLTGARQRTGNWPGVTVERKDGRLVFANGQRSQIVDLPGVYSLQDDIQGIDARVAHRYLQDGNPDLVLVLLDATRLPRQLSLLPDIIATGKPVLLVVNMLDSANAEGIEVDLQALRRESQLPVVGVVGATGEGVDQLKQTIQQLLRCYPAARNDLNIEHIARSCFHETGKQSRTEKIDRWLLHPALALPSFLLVMYLLFTVSVNLGAVFVDFFDLLLGAVFVDGVGTILGHMGSPEWLREIVANGIGGGIQLVGTFIPVIGFLYLCMSALEDSGYLSRAAFVIDRLMAKIGLPGQAFIPLIIGFGCNVPAVMASRALGQASARLTTIFIAPFMSCGARLSVYVFVGTAFFPTQAQNAIFALYLLGIAVAMISAWILRHKLFGEVAGANISEMPAYHRPLLRNVLTQTWHRLYSFIWRAGKRILVVVVLLNVFSSFGSDGSWGNQNSENSMLSVTGQVLTPLFVPMGIGDQNWQATVGLFTGLFAKEVVVGTLDTLYNANTPPAQPSSFKQQVAAAFVSIKTNMSGLLSRFADPLGIAAAQQDTVAQHTSFSAMQSAFPSPWAAFCYLVFILLYAPCVATIGVMQREAGQLWLGFSVTWSLLLSYWLASNLWQFSRLLSDPISAGTWIIGSSAVLYCCYELIMRKMRHGLRDQIPVINLQ